MGRGRGYTCNPISSIPTLDRGVGWFLKDLSWATLVILVLVVVSGGSKPIRGRGHFHFFKILAHKYPLPLLSLVSNYAHLRSSPIFCQGTRVQGFIGISQVLLTLQLAQIDIRISIRLFILKIYIYVLVYNSISNSTSITRSIHHKNSMQFWTIWELHSTRKWGYDIHILW